MTGGAATAVVAGLVALVGVLIARGVFRIPVLAPTSAGTWGNASTWRLVLLAALAAAITPFTTGTRPSTKVAKALIYAAIGGSIWSLVSSVAHSAVRLRAHRDDWPA